jgi:zinc protease
LREDKGFTYGIRSGFNGTKELGTYTISVSVRSTSTDSAIKEINLEVNKFIASGIEQEELDYAKKSLSQSDAMKYETPFDKASFLGQLVNYDLPTGYIDEQNKILNALTKEELNALAKELLPLDNMIYVVVGDKDKVRAPLEKSGYKVIEYKVD